MELCNSFPRTFDVDCSPKSTRDTVLALVLAQVPVLNPSKPLPACGLSAEWGDWGGGGGMGRRSATKASTLAQQGKATCDRYHLDTASGMRIHTF